MTDNEIVKALECCKYEYDTKCDLCCYNFYSRTGCRSELRRNALDLINRLQAENERLTQDKKTMSADMISLHNDLKSEKEVVCDKHFKIARLTKEIKTAKAEAIKEFAERLKLKVDIDLCEAVEGSDYLYNLPKLIDILVKEMMGEQNG